MLIRKIKSEDDPVVAAIIRDVMTEFGAVGPGFSIQDAEVDQISMAYAESGSEFYVVQDRAAVVGCGGIAHLKGAAQSICELKKMYFRPQARGQGLGRLLAETLIVDAQRWGYAKVYIETLDSMSAACKLYERLGFQRLESSLGDTGHFDCDVFYGLDLEPHELDPSLLA